MKQLISHHRDLVLLGLEDRAFLMNRTMSLSSSSTSLAGILELSKSVLDDNVKEPPHQVELNDIITAVAITSFVVPSTNQSTIFCAVARYDKTLSIYAINPQEDGRNIKTYTSPSSSSSVGSPTKKFPSMVYHSPKRVSCLTFARLPAGPNSTGYETIHVLISGDLVGDCYAYNVLEKGQRLLLGHTASMLTGVAILNGEHGYCCIATADRDEKIRISRFPETYIVDGYLLGHTKFVTAIDAVRLKGLILLVSCGGDKMIRLWDCTTMKELCSMSTADFVNTIPSDVAISASGRTVAVLFDESKVLQFYQVLEKDQEVKLVSSKTMDCPNVPLVISFDQSIDGWLVLMREPECLVYVKIDENPGSVVTSIVHDDDFLQSLRTLVANESISLPDSILEKDKQGNPILQKEVETRGASAEEVPWKRPERIATAKDKQRKRRRNRREKRTKRGRKEIV
jgi:WD40 repeat protein